MGKKLRFDFLDVNCCPYCTSNDFKKDGNRNFKQRYRCKNCLKTFYATTDKGFCLQKSERNWADLVMKTKNESILLTSNEYSGISRKILLLWEWKQLAYFVTLNEGKGLHDINWFDEIY